MRCPQGTLLRRSAVFTFKQATILPLASSSSSFLPLPVASLQGHLMQGVPAHLGDPSERSGHATPIGALHSFYHNAGEISGGDDRIAHVQLFCGSAPSL